MNEPGEQPAVKDAAVEFPRELDSHPVSRVRNGQAHGIGRVAELGDLVAWNNLGRNIVFADRSFRPRCIYDDTAFPDEDEPSQFDLDIHSILRPAGTDLVLALNHLGALRAFRVTQLEFPEEDRRARPIAEMRFAVDAERVVAAGARLLASRPRSEGGGLLVSRPLDHEVKCGDLRTDTALESWDPVTALEAWDASSGDAWIAVGAGRRIAVVPLHSGKLGRPRWEIDIPWQSAWLRWDAPILWVAGSEPPTPNVGDHDWDRLQGGGFLGLRLDDGHVVVQRTFGRDLAWGNGGVAVCMTNGVICGLDRRGVLHRFRARDGRYLGSTLSPVAGSIGIAHAVVVGGTVLAGFNRGGYRLFAYPVLGRSG